MKRRKHHSTQPSWFEPTFRWSDLPRDTQQSLVDQLARLLVQVGHTTQQHTTTDPVPQQTSSTQENQYDQP